MAAPLLASQCQLQIFKLLPLKNYARYELIACRMIDLCVWYFCDIFTIFEHFKGRCRWDFILKFENMAALLLVWYKLWTYHLWRKVMKKMPFQLMTITFFHSQNIPLDNVCQKACISWYTSVPAIWYPHRKVTWCVTILRLTQKIHKSNFTVKVDYL